eukprot:1036027-Amphidinium_carterae.2
MTFRGSRLSQDHKVTVLVAISSRTDLSCPEDIAAALTTWGQIPWQTTLRDVNHIECPSQRSMSWALPNRSDTS